MSEIYKHIIHIIITVVIVLIGLIMVKRNQPPAIVKIDLVAITSHYTALMAKSTLGSTGDNDFANRVSEGIKNNLEPIISQYAKANNVIVFQSQALVDGRVTDITQTVINQLDQKLQLDKKPK